MELDYDKSYYIMVKAMRVIHSHPEIKRDIKWLLKFLIMQGTFTIIFCMVMYSIIYHDLKMRDFSQGCRNGVLCIVYIVCSFKYFIMIWHQDILKKLIQMMRKDFESSKTFEDRELVLEYANKGKWLTKLWLGVSIFIFICFPLKSIILMTYYAVTDEFKLINLYEIQYPEFIENKKDNLIVFFVLYVAFSYYGIYATIIYVSFVPLGPTFMLHACGQLELVLKRLEKLFSEGSNEVEKEIQKIAKHLQYIYSFVELIKECFSVLYELTLKATAILLPITCYEVIESFHDGVVSIEFLSFMFGGILISSTPCYYSDLLMEKGENVRLAIYMCGWERTYNRGARASLLIMLTRALRPVAVRTMFRTVCLDALTDLFQQSYTIFNLMNAVMK